MKIVILSFFIALLNIPVQSQTNSDSTRLITIQKYYHEGIQYKEGIGVKQDFIRAFKSFQIAANLGDPQSIYSIGYMYFKGLGCSQDYTQAAALFYKGALQGRDNSMYFLGLCYKNGYGVLQNADSAHHWLHLADSLGYMQAKQELKLTGNENGNDSAKALVLQITNAALPTATPLNQFTAITHSFPSPDLIAGNYTGYIIQYDWSGKNVVSADKLSLSIDKNSGSDITAKWIEGKDTVPVSATLNNTGMEFKGTSYKRVDYYNYDSSGILYDFQKASLNMVQTVDSLFILGNINMFSPQRNEPSKPLMVVLARPVPMKTPVVNKVSAYPNPFSSELKVNLQLEAACSVAVQLYNSIGKLVYELDAGQLSAGSYELPLQPGILVPGVYFLRINYGIKTMVLKMVKE